MQSVREAAERFQRIAESRKLTKILNQQNEELKRWNAEPELPVQQQTIDIRKRNTTLKHLNERLRKKLFGHAACVRRLA